MPCCSRDLLHGDVQAGAGAGRSVVELAGIGLGVGDELRKCLPRRIAADHDAEGVAGQADDVGEILGGIERCLRHERIAEHGDRKLRHRIAVRFRVGGHLARPERAAGAAAVFDHDRLAEMLLRRGGERAQDDVGRAAGGERHDQCHRPVREILRLRDAAGCREHRSRQRGADELLAHANSPRLYRFFSAPNDITSPAPSNLPLAAIFALDRAFSLDPLPQCI